MKVKINIKEAWLYFVILAYILSSYSVYMVLLIDGSIVQLLSLVLSFFTIIALLKYTSVSKNEIMVSLVVAAVFIASTFFSSNDIYTTLLQVIRFIGIFLVVALYIKQEKNLLQVIYKCVFGLAIFYFCCYVIFDVIAPDLGLKIIREARTDVTGKFYIRQFLTHFKFYIRWDSTYEVFGISIDRLSGFCWESGQYQIYLNYGLMYLLFFDNIEKNRIKKIVFLCINIVLAASVMGLLIMIILFILKLAGMKNRKVKYLTFIPCALLAVIFGMQLIEEKSINSVYSYTSRTSEFSLLNDIFFKNSIFGEKVFTTNVANGVIRFLWTYGYIALGTIIIIAIMIVSRNIIFDSFVKKIAFGVWLVLSLFNEPIEFFNFTFLIISIIVVGYMYSKRIKYKIESSQRTKK